MKCKIVIILTLVLILLNGCIEETTETKSLSKEEQLTILEFLKENPITPQTVLVHKGNGIYDLFYDTGISRVKEDKKWIDIEKAKSLKDKTWIGPNGVNHTLFSCDNVMDGTHITKCVDFNYTSITFEFSYDETNLQEHELEIEDGKMKTKFKIIEYNNTLKQNIEKEYEIEIEEGKDLKYTYTADNILNLEFHNGENSTTSTINTNASGSYFRDNAVYADNTDANNGRATDLSLQGAGANEGRLILYIDMTFLSGQIVLNSTYEATCGATYGVDDYVEAYKLGQEWDEGPSTGWGTDNSSCDSPRSFPAQATWDCGNVSIGNHIGRILGSEISGCTGGKYFSISLDENEVQGWVDDNSSNKGWMMAPGGATIAFNMDSRENTGTEPRYVFTFEAAAPADTCTCTANTNCDVLCSDNCTISSAITIDTLTVTGEGSFTIDGVEMDTDDSFFEDGCNLDFNNGGTLFTR